MVYAHTLTLKLSGNQTETHMKQTNKQVNGRPEWIEEINDFWSLSRTSKTGWWFQIFFIFTSKIGEDEPILTSIFFKRVGEKPPTRKRLGTLFKNNHWRRLDRSRNPRAWPRAFRLRKRAPGNGWYLKFVHHEPLPGPGAFCKNKHSEIGQAIWLQKKKNRNLNASIFKKTC